MIIQPVATERLLIRPFRDDDWTVVYQYTSNPAVMAYIPEGIMTEAQAQEFVHRNQQADSVTAYGLLLKAEQTLIGHMIYHPWFAPRTYEIGWVLHPAYHRQGYASEAAAALLRYGFETMGLHRIIATCQPENPASYGVMEKIGMRREGHFQQCIYRGGEHWWDEYFYAMLAREWEQRRQASASTERKN